MEKFLLVPDSFKGTISSAMVCEIMEAKILERFPLAQVISIPVADGGEGSVDAFLKSVGGNAVTTTVMNPFMEEMEGFYGVINGDTAVIEMAACAGLPLAENRKNPLITTTYGVGQLMLHAVKSGCKKLIIGLGGSCTNDGGAGLATAVGVRFLDEKGESFLPTGGSLSHVAAIDTTGIDQALRSAEIIAMCDIDNPLFGSDGAAFVFAPQKGADASTVELLDKGLRHFAKTVSEQLGISLHSAAGAGAAGGLGYGLSVFLNAKLQSGIETVLDTVGFDSLAADADLIFTGEGKLDAQSLRGKVVIGVAQRAKRLSTPVIAVVGGCEGELQAVYDKGVTAVFSINRLPQDFSVSREFSRENLAFAMENILRLYNVGR